MRYLAYAQHFSPNAKLYLWSTFVGGVAMGVTYVVFNLYLLRTGLDESFLGLMVFYSSIAGVVFALPAGRASDRFGRRAALLVSQAVAVTALLVQIIYPQPGVLIPATVIAGAAWAVNMVTSAPLLVETSRPEERAHLFGLHSALMLGTSFVGSNLGGFLPRLFSSFYQVAPDAALPLQATLLTGAGLWLLATIPLFRLKEERGAPEPVAAAVGMRWLGLSDPKLVAKIILPGLVTSLGAGLIMPLQNVFMDRHLGATPEQIGLIFSLGALLTGVASLVAPALAERWGKVRGAAFSQYASLPFLALMGLAPHIWVYGAAALIRGALMNLSNPLVTNFNMELVSARERATVNSLVSMSWNLGWAVSGWAGGSIMANVSYTLPYAMTFGIYLVAITLFYLTFKDYERPPVRPVDPGPTEDRRKARLAGE